MHAHTYNLHPQHEHAPLFLLEVLAGGEVAVEHLLQRFLLRLLVNGDAQRCHRLELLRLVLALAGDL